MSAEFVNGVNQELIAHMKNFWGNRQDTIVNIEGLDLSAQGARIPNPSDVQTWTGLGSFPTNVASWNGSLDGTKDDTKLVAELKAFIEERYDPRGRLIITGKSRGAMNALQLCRHLAKFGSFFRLRKLSDWITDDEPKGDFWGSPPDNTPFTVKVRVDLICIADATFDVNGFDRQRQILGIVRSYANWFQTLEDNSGKHGALFPFETSLTAKIKDENCNGRIPLFTLGAHTFLCKKLAPPEVTKLVGADLGTPTPQLTPTIRGSTTPTPQLTPNFRARR